MFQTIGLNVNKYLRKKVENQNELTIPSYLYEDFALLAKLAKNETQSKTFLDSMWNKYGNFAHNNYSYSSSIKNMIKSLNTSSQGDGSEVNYLSDANENDDT